MQAMMQALLAQQQQALQAPEPLIKMKAGKMEVKNSPTTPGKFLVSPKPDKGILQLVKDEQGYPKLQWKNRVTDMVDPMCDHMVFPGTASFKKTATGRPGDRVVLLQFTGSERRFFFWLQDKDDGKDNELITKFSDALNGTMPADDAPPPLEGEGRADTQAAAAAAGAPVQMADLLRVLGLPAAPAPVATPAAQTAAAGSTTPASAALAAPTPPVAAAASATAGGGGGTLTNADLMRAMAGLQMPALSPRSPPLQEVVTSDAVVASEVLADPTVQAALLPTLPEGHQTTEAMSSLSSALSTENYGSVIANFGLDAAAGAAALARGDNVGAFLAAVQAQADAAAPAPPLDPPASKDSMEDEK
jgi:hypothetical protein